MRGQRIISSCHCVLHTVIDGQRQCLANTGGLMLWDALRHDCTLRACTHMSCKVCTQVTATRVMIRCQSSRDRLPSCIQTLYRHRGLSGCMSVAGNMWQPLRSTAAEFTSSCVVETCCSCFSHSETIMGWRELLISQARQPELLQIKLNHCTLYCCPTIAGLVESIAPSFEAAPCVLSSTSVGLALAAPQPAATQGAARDVKAVLAVSQHHVVSQLGPRSL